MRTAATALVATVTGGAAGKMVRGGAETVSAARATASGVAAGGVGSVAAVGTSDLYNNFASKTQNGASAPEDYVKALLLGGAFGGVIELATGGGVPRVASESSPAVETSPEDIGRRTALENESSRHNGEAEAPRSTSEVESTKARTVPAEAAIETKAEKIGKEEAKDTIRAAEPPAVKAAQDAYRQAFAQNKSAGEAEAAAMTAAKHAVEVVVEARMAELEAQGHGPQRHGPQVTDEQLKARANFGHDPVTGTKFDAYKKKPNGTPEKHSANKTASRINSASDYVKGEEFIRDSEMYQTEKARTEAEGGIRFGVDVPLESVFGVNYESKVAGLTRTGPKNTVTDTPTNFRNGTLQAYFLRDADTGNWNLVTMFAEPMDGG